MEMDHYPGGLVYPPVLHRHVFLLEFSRYSRYLAKPTDRNRKMAASPAKRRAELPIPHGRHYGEADPGIILFFPFQIPVSHYRLATFRLSERANRSTH